MEGVKGVSVVSADVWVLMSLFNASSLVSVSVSVSVSPPPHRVAVAIHMYMGVS